MVGKGPGLLSGLLRRLLFGVGRLLGQLFLLFGEALQLGNFFGLLLFVVQLILLLIEFVVGLVELLGRLFGKIGALIAIIGERDVFLSLRGWLDQILRQFPVILRLPCIGGVVHFFGQFLQFFSGLSGRLL